MVAKHELERALAVEKRDISSGRIREDNPLDESPEFKNLCVAARRGDLKSCHELIQNGANVNGRDIFDYTPLILASLCGHYEVVQLLLESGALCERDTFQGERCLYNALNDRIKSLLLEYDYSKSTDPLQPLAAHVTSLLNREFPKTADLNLVTDHDSLQVHKFILSARSPYFHKKLREAPSSTTWRLPNTLPFDSIWTTLRYIYMGEISLDIRDDEEEKEVLTGIDKFSRQVEIERLFETTLERDDRRLTRQRMQDEVTRGRDELYQWFRDNIVRNKIMVETRRVNDVKWDKNNSVFADVLLRADNHPEDSDQHIEADDAGSEPTTSTPRRRPSPGPNRAPSSSLNIPGSTIPIGSFASRSRSRSPAPGSAPATSVLYPVHRAMLLRSEYFLTMFSSAFKEAQDSQYLHIITMDCSPAVLETVLAFLYTETAEFPLEQALEVLFVADQLFIEKLKVKAAATISSLGAGLAGVVDAGRQEEDEEILDIYDVIRAGWATRVHRLEEFGARYLANRLEKYIDEEEFSLLVRESAERIMNRQETDTVELVDDIRYYLSERFRLRFEDAGLGEAFEEGEVSTELENGSVDKENGAPVEAINGESAAGQMEGFLQQGVVRNLEGDDVDEFEEDALKYQELLGKIDLLLEKLKLDA